MSNKAKAVTNAVINKAYDNNFHPSYQRVLNRTLRKYVGRVALVGGFTLIELLVVVLIIGILTAVAVPQYKQAVLKSRFITTLKVPAEQLRRAQNLYYIEHGKYASDWSDLGVDIPNQPSCYVQYDKWKDKYYMLCARGNLKLQYRFWMSGESMQCIVEGPFADDGNYNTLQDKMCQQETGQITPRQHSIQARQYDY